MPSHTAGPWTVEPDMRTDQNKYGQGDREFLSGWNIMSAAGEVVGCEGILADGEANARVIAAAPEMLEALHAVVRVADRKTAEFDLARAAIAKAESQ